MSKQLSPARETVAGCQEKVTAAMSAVEAVKRPLFEARDRTSAEKAELARLEAELQKASDAEVASVLGNDGKKPAVERLRMAGEATAKWQSAVDRCERVLAVLETRRAELEGKLAEQERLARPAADDLQRAVNAVLVEEGLAAVARMVDAYAVLGDAAAAVDGLREALCKRGANADGDKIGAALRAIRRPEPRNDVQKYLDFAARLATDPGAKLESLS